MPMALEGLLFKTTGQRGSDRKTATEVDLVPSMMNKQTFLNTMIIQVPARILY